MEDLVRLEASIHRDQLAVKAALRETVLEARLSWLRLHELYTKIRWKEDAAETCNAMWKAYPGDAEVKLACGAAPAAAADSTATKVPPVAVASPAAFARPAPRVTG